MLIVKKEEFYRLKIFWLPCNIKINKIIIDKKMTKS